MSDMNDKIAVVTGGNRGIGRFIAKALAEAGATVAITGRNHDAVQATANELGNRVVGFLCDHSVPDSIAELAENVRQHLVCRIFW